MAATPSEINAMIAQARCIDCYPAPIQSEIQTYIMAVVAGTTLDPIALAKLAKCMTCLSTDTLLRIKAYLLSIIHTGIANPEALIDDSQCYECVPEGFLQNIETFKLLHDPQSPNTDPAVVARLSRCYGCLSPQTLLEVQVYLLALIARLSPDPNSLARDSNVISVIPTTIIRRVITREIVDLEDDGGLSGCTDVLADLIPVMTVNYVAGVANTIDVLFPKVCCQPNSFTIYESNNADMSASVDLDIIPMAGATPGEENFVVAGVDVSGATRTYLAVKQNCLDGTVSDFSNIEDRIQLAFGLAAYWKMDEAGASGPRADSFAAETLTDAVPNTPSQAALISNGARFNLATVTQRLRHIDDAVLGIGAGVSFTFSLWVQLIQDATNAPFLAKFAPAPLYDYVLVEFAGNVNWTVRDVANTNFFTVISPGLPPIGPWIHFACGYDDALQQIWIQRNAGARVSGAVVGVRRTASDFCIGNYSDGSGGGDFIIDEVGFWRRSLSTAEITLLYNGGAGITYPF